MEFWLIQILNGLSWSMLLFLLATGLTLIFGLMGVVNVAHGAFYMVGGYLAVAMATRSNNFLLVVIAGGLGMGLIGGILYRFIVQRLRGQIIPGVLLTMGLMFVLNDLSLWAWGGDVLMYSIPTYLEGNIKLGFIRLPAYRVFVIFVGLAIAIALGIVHKKTRLGALIRASVDDEEMATGLGTNVSRLSIGIFTVGSLLAGLGGAIGTPIWGVYPGLDSDVLALAFAVVIIGGFGSIMGTLVGSFFVGFIDVFGKALFPEVSVFAIFASMAIILAIRPKGILGK